MPKISQTAAFTLCDGGSCDEPKAGSAPETLTCKAGDKCKGAGCYCQLFQRDKDAKDDDPWDVTPVDGAGEGKKDKDLKYTCLCVKPILPTGYTLCDVPLCTLTDSQEIGSAPRVECTGTCADPCKCTLFRLHVKPKKAEKKAKVEWEFVAKAGTKMKREGGYYYRCFCTK